MYAEVVERSLGQGERDDSHENGRILTGEDEMTRKRLIALCALCVIVSLALFTFADLADAASKDASAKSDKKVSQRRGISGSLASGDDDDDDGDGPNAVQMGFGVGSIFVMIAVVKWL